jgi:hypothetical protein
VVTCQLLYRSPLTCFRRLILRNNAKHLSKFATPTQTLDIVKKRERLQSRIDAFHDKASSFLVDVELDGGENEWVTDYTDDLEDPDDNPFEPPVRDDSELLEPENVPIILPSTIGMEKCIRANLSDIVQKELSLRQGQANDALQGLRMAIGKKSFLFRTRLRPATSKVQKLRSWSDIGAMEASVRHQARVYRKCRQALIRLGASDEIMKQYQVLTKEQLVCSTVVTSPNARGQREVSLAWFWSLNVQGDCVDNELMTECEYLL